jgi:hypothetical protein
MTKKLAAFIVLAPLIMPLASLAQSPANPENSIENLNVADIADDSIVVLSSEETGVPGYVHQKYAFLCLGELSLVDHYGAPINPEDQNLLQFERQMCSRQQNNDSDSSED